MASSASASNGRVSNGAHCPPWPAAFGPRREAADLGDLTLAVYYPATTRPRAEMRAARRP